jgi:hypothetical protein
MMKRKRLRSNDNRNDNVNHNTSSSSDNAPSSNQLAANDDPFFLLQYVRQNPDVYRRVIIEMALETSTESSSSSHYNASRRDYGSSSNGSIRSSGSSKQDGETTAAMSIMDKGFLWKEFKPLEQVLWHSAAEYFRLSQSFLPQLKHAFTDRLEDEICQTAAQHNISMSDYFDDDRNLRDRIRSFYKNLMANAKKRFANIAKHNSEKDRENLWAILLLIANKEADVEEEDDDDHKETSRTSPTASWDPDQLTESTPAATLVSPETADSYYFDWVARPILDNTPSRKKQRTGVVRVLDTSTAVLLPSHCTVAAALNKIPLLLDAELLATETDLPKTSDTLMSVNQAAAVPSSKQVASAEKLSIDSAQVHADWSDLLNASQDSTALEPGANSLLTTYKAPKNARIPTRGTDEWTIWNRLNTMGRGLAENNPLAKGSPLIHLRTVHELLRTRLAAGMLRTALKLCHTSITNIYNDAEEAARGSPIESLKRIRTVLAGAWCLYAHILWEIGALEKEVAFHGSTDQRKVAASTLHQPHHVWEKHAIAVLKAATACPLVGNHSWITLAAARLTILQSLGNNSSSEMSTRKTTESVRVAIALCWDSIVPMDGPSREETSLLALASHELCFSPLMKEKVTVGVLKKSFKAVSALPTRFRGISDTAFILDDKNSILAVCTEVSRLSRLQEKLVQLSNAPLSLVGYGCDELDSFALFRARDVVLDTTTLPREGTTQEALGTHEARPRVPLSRSPGAPGSACTKGCQNIFDTAEDCNQHESSSSRHSRRT